MISADTATRDRLAARPLAGPVPHLDPAPPAAVVTEAQAAGMDDMAEYACPALPAEAVTHFCHGEPQDYVPTRRSGLDRAFTLWKRCVLAYKIRSSERYLALCEREGITVGRTISEWQSQLQLMRDELRALEGQL